MRDKKKILVSILIFAIFACIAVKIFAAEGDTIDILGNIPTVNNNTNTTGNIISNNIINNTPTLITQNTTNKVNNNTNSNTVMPNAGLDTSITFVIIAFGISAVYAYKKIKDYNIK